MQVISDQIGFALKFESLEDLIQVANNLYGQIEWIQKEEVEPPYIYLTYAGKCNQDDAREFMNKLKEQK
jgi:tryptophan synthase alpha subunit